MSACSIGGKNVVASDVRLNRELLDSGPFSYCDVTDKDNLARIILENGVDTVVHLATLLSGERGVQDLGSVYRSLDWITQQ